MDPFADIRAEMNRDAWLAMAELRGGLSPTATPLAKYLLDGMLEPGDFPETEAAWLMAALDLLERVPSKSPLS